jgi:DNA methylase
LIGAEIQDKHLGDMIESEIPDKRFHKFGQNPKDAEWIMKYITAPNDLVLDPFVGGGSTDIACMNMRRRFIGPIIKPTTLALPVR